MSDHVPNTEAELRRFVGRCEGGSSCACRSESGIAVRPECSCTPSRSRTSSSDGGRSGDSSENLEVNNAAASESESLPDGTVERDWSRMHVVRLPKCSHGRHAIMKRAYGGPNTSRRYLGCPIKEEEQQCQFIEWQDEPWPERLQESLKQLWTELKTTRRNEARATDALNDALRANDIANNSRSELVQEVNRTKRVVERVCQAYYKKAAHASVAKCKAMFLVYCLIGVIVFFVMAFVMKN